MTKQDKDKRDSKRWSYRNDLEYLEDHFRLLDLLGEQRRNFGTEGNSMPEDSLRIERKIQSQLQVIRRRKSCSTRLHKNFSLDRIVSRYHLHPIERKILIFLLYRYFSSDGHSTPGRIILENITRNRLEMMRFRHYLMENGRLRTNKLLTCEETLLDKSILDLEFNIPEELVSQLLGEKPKMPAKGCKERSYKYYLNLWFSLVSLMEEKAEVATMLRRDNTGFAGSEPWEVSENTQDLSRIRYNIRKTEKDIDEFDKLQESFPLEEVSREYQLNRDEKLILVVLLRDSLGLSDSFMGYEGKKLLAIISESENEMIAKRSLLYQKSKLRVHNLVHMERNWGGQNILDAEYCLSEKMIRRLLGHSSQEESGADDELQDDEGQVLLSVAPRFSLSEVVLPEAQKKHIEIALSQQLNRDLIFKEWGFGKNIPYGNSLTMLFSGPPGTGKTMLAEAIAHSLQKKLLIANYAQIHNLYVGETEKRIVAVFRKAREEQEVLLWDEADSMFFSRDIARNSWEYRDVNILLQELEKFPGVVILTTNRKIALDWALERRIAVKLEFEMPGVKEREAIWKSLIPKEAPLAQDVDFGRLAEKFPVSGGIIKNAVLHAARYAAYRKSAVITMEDFRHGMELETTSSWESRDKIGFTGNSSEEK